MRDGEMSVMATATVPGGRAVARLAREVRMNEELKMTWLRYSLRLVSIGYIAAFIPWITLILLRAPIVAPGGSLAPMLRFQPYNADYESMITAISLVWALMLWRASDDPAKHVLFIDFTIWASAAHGFVMLIATPVQKGLPMTLVEGVPLFFLAAALWWLRPGTSPRGAAVSPLRRGVRPLSGRARSSARAGVGGKGVVHRGRRFSRVSMQAFSSVDRSGIQISNVLPRYQGLRP